MPRMISGIALVCSGLLLSVSALQAQEMPPDPVTPKADQELRQGVLLGDHLYSPYLTARFCRVRLQQAESSTVQVHSQYNLAEDARHYHPRMSVLKGHDIVLTTVTPAPAAPTDRSRGFFVQQFNLERLHHAELQETVRKENVTVEHYREVRLSLTYLVKYSASCATVLISDMHQQQKNRESTFHYECVPLEVDTYLSYKVFILAEGNCQQDLDLQYAEKPSSKHLASVPKPVPTSDKAIGKLGKDRVVGVWVPRSDRCCALVEVIKVGFDGPFRVFPRGDDDYLLTETGRLHVAKPGKGKVREATPIYLDDDRPVHAFIQDLDSDKVFLFTKVDNPKRDLKPTFFELAEKPAPKEFDPKTLKAFKLDEPLKTVLPYALFTREQQKKR